MNPVRDYTVASIKTAEKLRTVARSLALHDVSQLTLPEVEGIVDLVSRIIPAGNVPGVILNGLARLKGRKPPRDTVRRDINLLFKGIEQTLDRAVYGAFFMGPAAVIWGYQNLLKLAGKDPDDAFPEGVWQFYVDYALREDTARHANETHGFDTLLQKHGIELDSIDRATAWAMAAIHCLHQYDNMLANEWRERVYLNLLTQVTADGPDPALYTGLARAWAKQRPYRRGADAGSQESYPQYRRRMFDNFVAQATQELGDALRRDWQTHIRTTEAHDLPAYQRQMTILAYLDPGPHNETRTPFPLEKALVGLIAQGHYTLIPICAPDSSQPADVHTVRQQIATAVHTPPPPGQTTNLTRLATARRSNLDELCSHLNPTLVENLEALRYAPILLNTDQRPRALPLAELRQTERGVGSHALTIFDTGESFVFDQSHIFFDGAWGAALAEILTNEALSWANYLRSLPAVQLGLAKPITLSFPVSMQEETLLRQTSQVTPEVSVENDGINLGSLLILRRLMKRRSDLIRLTVNDLLILYRAIHAVTYQPDSALVKELQQLSATGNAKAASAALESLNNQSNPAILIPVDASQRSPRDRLYPMTFEVPLADLDLLDLHRRTVAALQTYRDATGDRDEYYARFDHLQRTYLATLAGFGQVLSRAKEIATAGETISIGTLKLLAHVPKPLQRMLEQVPGRFDVLNDILKGREVFSNVGAVALGQQVSPVPPGSTLTRFITAKDDNEKKTLAWGVITDAQGVMRLSLRDFRSHVAPLIACGRKDLALRIAEHYLETYVQGLNRFLIDLHHITQTSRETRLSQSEPGP